MRFPHPSFLLALLAILPIRVSGNDLPIWLVIGDEKLQEAAAPLLEYRRSEGFDVRTSTLSVKKALENLVKQPNYIVLLGDDVLSSEPEQGAYLKGERRTLYRWQKTQPEGFVSDAVFGDTDGDEIPDIPVGRLPGRTPEAVSQIARKIVHYENLPATQDVLRFPVWAGNPAYGDHFQANMASNLLRQTLHMQAPVWADLDLIMGNATDPLSAVPEKHVDLFHESLAKGGGLFTGLMGHGGNDAFYSMPVGRTWIAYHSSQVEQVVGTVPASPAIIFSCDCGNFAHSDESLAESLLKVPGGPSAVIAATTQSHPLPNYYSSICWLQELKRRPSDRLGDIWVAAQKAGYKKRDALVELVLANIEGKLEGKLDTPRIRKDHVLLYALLGDPATRLKQPLPLKATFEREGDQWRWTVTDPPRGADYLQIAHRTPPPLLEPKAEDLSDQAAMVLYRKASSALQFQELLKVNSPTSWTGLTQHRRGTLRLAVQAAGRLRVAAKELQE